MIFSVDTLSPHVDAFPSTLYLSSNLYLFLTLVSVPLPPVAYAAFQKYHTPYSRVALMEAAFNKTFCGSPLHPFLKKKHTFEQQMYQL